MSFYRLFQGMLGRLRRRPWGLRFELEGEHLDSGVQALADELHSALSSDAPIELTAPIRITRTYSGPAFEISGNESALSYRHADGSTHGVHGNSQRVHIVSIEDDTLTVQDDFGTLLTILKPYDLRRSTTDRKTINSITYTFSDPQTRDASGTVERVTPPYTFGEEIIAVFVEDGYMISGPNGVEILYTDVNTGAKIWKPEDSPANPADNTRWRIASVADYSALVPTIAATGATNTTPIVMTVENHGLQTGEHCTIRDVEGNTAANGTWEVDANTCRIISATNASPIVIRTDTHHGFLSGDAVRIHGVRGNTAANNTNSQPFWYVTYINDIDVSLWQDSAQTVPVVGNGTYDDDSKPAVSLANKFRIYELVPHTQDVTDATNAAPIVLEVVGHGLLDNSYVIVLDVGGNTAANNTSSTDVWQIDYVDADHFSLRDSDGTTSGAYTSGGTVSPAYENFLDGVVGNGSYVSGTGTMIIPGRITITGATRAEAEAVGFRVGLGIRMRSAEGGTTFGVITAIPGTEGYPYHRPSPTRPVNVPYAMSFAGHPLLGNLTELAVGVPAMVVQQTMICNHFPHYGSATQLPISQLVQNTPPERVAKWRCFGGGNVLSRYGKSLSHWYGPAANCVAFQFAHTGEPSPDTALGTAFSGGFVTIVPDRERPMNAVGLHTDGSILFGARVTKTAAPPFGAGHTLTGLKGWAFHKTQTGAGPPTLEILERSTVAQGGDGSDDHVTITSSTDATPIVVTCADHGLSTGRKIRIASHVTNVAANATHWVIKLSDDTFSLYSDSTMSTPVAGSGAGVGSGGYFTHGLATDELIVESMTMESVAATKYWLENFAHAPFVNIDIGGQLLSNSNRHRGIRGSLFNLVLNYNTPVGINRESSDVPFNSRQEVAVLGLGNRPGAREDVEPEDGASQFLSVFLTFVLE